MQLRIISKEIIKPSSPTPHHLKTYKLSLLDQLAPDIYFSVVLFYSASSVDKNPNRLKNSLSKTLTHYYPFAGRVRDIFSIDCDDSGVPFVEAHAESSSGGTKGSNMHEVLKNPEVDFLEQLLPFNPNKNLTSLDPNVAVQLSYFNCGGVAVGFNFRHIVADGAAAISFIKNWAKVACGCANSGDVIKDAVVDCTSMFPPSNKISSYARSINERQRAIECVTKSFSFDATKIAALRKEIIMGSNESEEESEYRPSRFEAVCALIWRALIDMDRSSTAIASIPVNLRNRMNPPLPGDCTGNLFHAVTCTVDNNNNNKAVDYRSLARNIHGVTKMVSDEFVRKLYEGGVYENLFMEAVEEILKSGGGTNDVRLFGFSGPIGFPYYDIDFGWGKPLWVTTVMRLSNTAMLLDTCDGKGIEAWVGLPNNDMPKFEQHPGILAYASFTPSTRSRI